MGGGGRSDYSVWRRDRLFFPGEHLYALARFNHGAGWRRVYLSGGARRTWRDVEARKEACFDKLCAGGRFNRGSQSRVATAWVAHASRVVASASSRSRTSLDV